MSEDFLYMVDVNKVNSRPPIVGHVYILALRTGTILELVAIKHASCDDPPYSTSADHFSHTYRVTSRVDHGFCRHEETEIWHFLKRQLVYYHARRLRDF